ncbi:hypothetical protein EHZ19_28340 [Paraburkholderia bannensis]|nr:hypothetical protein [Paraburkholderia bannensis]RQM44480.1 hypothetical protein EHZ19_28340 [Paraburkholderia bannensis]
MDTNQLPDDLNPEVVKACAEFIGKITGLVPPPHDAFPPEWHGYLRTFTSRLYATARENVVAADAVTPTVPIELLGVEDELKNGDGFWRTCSGCHETEDGHPVGHYPFSAIMNCDLGSGCGECGGIGAVWDDTDYDAVAAASDADEIAREQSEEARPVDQRALVQSMDEIEALSNTEDRGITVMEAESIMLVLLELRRLRAGGSPAPWTWLRRAVRRIPTREELLGGQRTSYVQLDEVLGRINEGEKMGDTLCNAPTPTVAADAAAPILTAPEGEDPMKHGNRSIKASVKRLTDAYCKQQPLPVPDQMALVWRFDIGRLRNDWIRLNAWQESVKSNADADTTCAEYGGSTKIAHCPSKHCPRAAQPNERAAFVQHMGYDRPETEGCARLAWDAHLATWTAARATSQATVKGDDRF